MGKGTLVLSIQGGADNWSPRRWVERFNALGNGRKVVLLPDPTVDPDEVAYAAVWKPQPGVLAAFRHLRVIFNLGAGVDALLADPSLPKVPIVRVAVDDLTGRMTEYVVLHVLMHHRQQRSLRDNQSRRLWQPGAQWAAGAVTVGIRGLGTLGCDAAEVLHRIGFRVVGWSNSAKAVEGVECFSGRDGLASFLAKTHIMVCLLPLTPETRGILNSATFAGLRRGGYLIQVGRGEHLVENDLLAALDSGQLAGAALDVFATEPLPAAHPFWTHPNILVTPHDASDVSLRAVATTLVTTADAIRAGLRPPHAIDRARGY